MTVAVGIFQVEEIDLDFVAQYDKAFSTFLSQNSDRFDKQSELVQNLKKNPICRCLVEIYNIFLACVCPIGKFLKINFRGIICENGLIKPPYLENLLKVVKK